MLWCIIGLVLLAFLPYAYLDYREYWCHRSQIASELATMPAKDRRPPAQVASIIERFYGFDRIDSLLGRDLELQFNHGPDKRLRARLREMILAWELRFHLSRAERMALFCHRLSYDGGSGLTAGAEAYYGKSPEQLDDVEVAGLIASSLRGRSASPFLHPERFEKERQDVLRRTLIKP